MSTIERLRRRPDFVAASSGRRFHTERLTAQGRLRRADEVRDGVPATGLHLGFTITKRVGHATERNRIRRRLRGALAAAAPGLPRAAADVVLIARRPALDAPFSALVADLMRAVEMVTKPRGPKPSSDKPAGDGTAGAKPSRAKPSRTKPSSAEARRPGDSPPRGSAPADRTRTGARPRRGTSTDPNAPHGPNDG